MSLPWEGLRVVEVGTGIAVAYGGKLLADLGADVVKVAPVEDSSLFHYLNTNKRFASFVPADADVVIGSDSGAPVTVQVSPFGRTGPYRDYAASDLTIQASAGLMASRGLPEREPVMAGGRLVGYIGGVHAAVAALTGVLRGGSVAADVSLRECVATVQPFGLLQNVADRWAEMPVARSARGSRPGIMRCKYGYVGINALTGQQWADCCRFLEVPEFEDQQFSPEFLEKIQPWLDERTVDEVVERGQLFRVPTAPLGNGKTLLEFEQFRTRGFYIENPFYGFTQPSFPYRFSGFDLSLRAPLEPFDGWRSSRRTFGLDLRGVRVLDLTTFWSGPAATMYLAGLGADVIKVESIQRPDGFRPSGAPRPGTHPQWYEQSLIWQGGNLDKRGITLDLTSSEGMALFTRLLATADVLTENFAPRVVENFGLSDSFVRSIRPDVVYLRSPGFGLEGPWRDWVGWAMAFEQASGMAWVTGYPDVQPMTIGGACDGIVAMHTVVAILSALSHRARTGRGQHIEVAQTEVAACLTAEQVIEYSFTGRVLERTGNRLDGVVQGVYRCRGESRWVALTLDDVAAFPVALDGCDHDEIDKRIASWTSTRSFGDVVSELQSRGIPSFEVLTGAQLHGDPHLIERGMMQDLEHPVNGTHPFFTWPITYSFGRLRHSRAAPTLGQHNDEILGGELGLSVEELDALRAKQVIGNRALHW